MIKMKSAVMLTGCLVFSLTACSSGGNREQPLQTQEAARTAEPTQIEEINQTRETTLPESNAAEKETAAVEEQTEEVLSGNSAAEIPPTQAVGASESEMTADELLDSFINGSISAVDAADSTSVFYITDLNMDAEEWDSYSIGEKVDLDNDGENELILNGPYGGIYLDARDGQVYGFAAGEGNGFTLSYTYFKGAIWILYSNRMHQGYESYHMELFEGADNLVAEMNFNEELIDEDNVEGPEKYYLNGTEITYEEYLELSSEIFAAQVNTN